MAEVAEISKLVNWNHVSRILSWHQVWPGQMKPIFRKPYVKH